MKRFLSLNIIAFILINHSVSQNIKQELNDVFCNRQLMGMTALAVCNDSIIFSENIGTADYIRNIPVTDSTLFRVASISKTVTATAFMILYEKGLVKLDEDIGNILGYSVRNPDYPDVAITPRMLLSHTSGIQDGTGYSGFITDTYREKVPPKIISLLSDTGKYFSADIWQKHSPGTYFSYCNLNFGIVATIIEKISGVRFDIFCKKNIFDPLGMTASYKVQDFSNINNVAVLYRMNNGVWQPQADNYQGVKPDARDLSTYIAGDNGVIFGPQGGLKINAKSLAVFMMMHMNGGIYKGIRILNPSTIKLMHSPEWLYNGKNGDNYFNLFRSWGYGFHLVNNSENGDIAVNGYKMLGHYGESYGMLGDMYFNEENKFGIIFITNGSKAPYEESVNTAFYAVEADVFSVLNKYEIQPCLHSDNILYAMNDYDDVSKNEKSKRKNIRFYLPEEGNVKCEIYNVFGLKVSAQQFYFNSYGRKQISINTSGLSDGIYFCNINAKGNSRKFSFSITGGD
ncbi:MAG TPA: serine hydrolase [Bacteroidales bacterium]|nr:serine hydrolase [Bacteroidales bacterium]HPS17386.1 serine hydrolase [Bacteroidales bacterium]